MKNGNWRINLSPSVRGEYVRLRHKRIRERAINALGGKCAHCGFNDIRALHIDHIHGGGKDERESKRGTSYHYHILKRIESGDYQVLCANCNYIKVSENNERKINPLAFTNDRRNYGN